MQRSPTARSFGRRCGPWLAVLLLSAPVAAATGNEGDASLAWMQLDSELAALTQTVDSSDSGVELSMYLKSSYRRSDDLVYTFDPVTFAPLGDLGGFAQDSAGISMRATVEDFDVKVGYNPVTSKLRSTYVRQTVTDELRITLGKFKVPLLRSRLVSTMRLLFLDRSVQARATGPRELGLKFEFDLTDEAQLLLAVQNGDDGTAEELRVTGRLNLDLLGGGVSKYEGAYNAKRRLRGSLGLAASDDASFADGRVLAADGALSYDRFSLAAEVVDHGDDLGLYSKGLIDPATIMLRGGTRAWGASASWMLIDDRLELAGRVQRFDDPSHTEMLTLGLNHYVHGHHAKLQFNWIEVSSDITGLESTVLALGFAVDA